MIRIQQWRNHVFNRSFLRRRRPFITQHPLLLARRNPASLSVGLKKLDDKWSLNSAKFCRCRSCDFTDLNTTTGKQIPKHDWFSRQEVMSFYRYQFWSDYRWGALVMSFTGYSLYRLPVGAAPVEKPLQWLPVISFFDPGTSTRGLSTGGSVGVLVPAMFL